MILLLFNWDYSFLSAGHLILGSLRLDFPGILIIIGLSILFNDVIKKKINKHISYKEALTKSIQYLLLIGKIFKEST